jgi:hypothetical protein
MDRLLALPINMRLGLECMAVTNALSLNPEVLIMGIDYGSLVRKYETRMEEPYNYVCISLKCSNVNYCKFYITGSQ